MLLGEELEDLFDSKSIIPKMREKVRAKAFDSANYQNMLSQTAGLLTMEYEWS